MEDDCVAVNFLKLLHQSDDIDPLHVRCMNFLFVTACENTSNSATSAARLTISTKSDLYSSLVSAIATFKGPIHGGACESVMRYVLPLKSIEHADDVLEEKWKKKEIVYGFGHSYYNLNRPDPRV